MKKNLKFIAMAAAVLLCACAKTEETTTAVTTVEKPKVKVATVTTEAVAQLEEYATTVEAKVKNSIIPNSPLRIEKIFVEVGDNVKKGDKLVQLDAKDLDKLHLQYEFQKRDFERIEELYRVGGIAKADYENAKTQLEVTKKTLDSRTENTMLICPIDGVITARNYDDGDMYGGQAILVVEQISPVKMKINVSESYYARTDKDLDVTLTFDAYGDKEFNGKYRILGSDNDPKCISLAMANARKAQVDNIIQFRDGDATKMDLPAQSGVIICNPPYGQRMMEQQSAQRLYAALGRHLKYADGWKKYVITSEPEFEHYFGRRADKKRKLYNGMIKCDLYMYTDLTRKK